MNETPLDRIARALGDVLIRQEEGVNVYLSLAVRLEMARAALSVIRPESEADRTVVRVLPAKFITDAMANVPDGLPRDFA